MKLRIEFSIEQIYAPMKNISHFIHLSFSYQLKFHFPPVQYNLIKNNLTLKILIKCLANIHYL